MEAQLREMAAEDPTTVEPLVTLGDILREEERFDEAAKVYSRAVDRLGPSNARHWPLYYSRGIAYERAKDWDAAERDFLKALELQPEQPFVLNYLGYSWVEQGEHLSEAFDMIEKAVEQRPDDGYIVDSLGWAHYRLGDYGEAVKYLERAEAKDRARIATIQNEYNLLYRHHDLDMAELAYHEDVGLLAFSPLAAGLLTGKYRNGKRPEGSRAAVSSADLGGRLQEHQEPAVDAYCKLAETHGLDPAQMALGFVLSRPFVTAAIIGATSMEQLKTNIAAADVAMTDDILGDIARVHRTFPAPI